MLVLHRSIIWTRYVIAMARRNLKAKENIDVSFYMVIYIQIIVFYHVNLTKLYYK